MVLSRFKFWTTIISDPTLKHFDMKEVHRALKAMSERLRSADIAHAEIDWLTGENRIFINRITFMPQASIRWTLAHRNELEKHLLDTPLPKEWPAHFPSVLKLSISHKHFEISLTS